MTAKNLTVHPTDPQTALFDQWAAVYDTQVNPLLALEERTLFALLPAIKGADVLDVGCGTGRWLHRLEPMRPASLTGVDPSAAMLAQASLKLAPTTDLHQGNAADLPGADSSKDLILASFVLSYLDDLDLLAAECARLLRPGGRLLVSDMHPATAVARRWTRTFSADDAAANLRHHARQIPEVLACFARHGLHLARLVQPSFAAPERPLFEQTGKLAAFQDLENTPAIYLLELHIPEHGSWLAQPDQSRLKYHRMKTLDFFEKKYSGSKSSLQTHNAAWALDPKSWAKEPLHPEPSPDALDLSGYVLLPGLINAHDHLEFALFPNLGRTADQPCYQNSAEWAREIHQRHTATIQRHLAVPLEVRLWWGAIRNLLSGVTTVCHHNRLHPELSNANLPVHVVEPVGWAHSLTFDADLAGRFSDTPHNQPFILHAGEGIDVSSREELYTLDRMGLLDPRIVLVHGLAFGSPEVELLNRRRAALVLCPTSNLFLFSRTLTKSLISALHYAALGSDSPLTAHGDLLDEIHYLHTTHKLDPSALYRLVTTQPAGLLRLRDGQGQILAGSQADLIAVPQRHRTPADTLAHLTLADIQLVLLSGRVYLASPTLYDRLPDAQRHGLSLLTIEGHQRWIRAPLPMLFAAAKSVLVTGELRLGNKEIRLGPH